VALPGQLIGCRAAHCAKPDHYHIIFWNCHN
jgi:hypothetical protein